MSKSRSSHPRSRLLEEIAFKSWWVLLFFFTCFFAYDQAVKEKEKEEIRLKEKAAHLLQQKEQTLKTQEELRLKLESKDDPYFIELVLMQRLGLVPEGYQKFIFSPT